MECLHAVRSTIIWFGYVNISITVNRTIMHYTSFLDTHSKGSIRFLLLLFMSAWMMLANLSCKKTDAPAGGDPKAGDPSGMVSSEMVIRWNQAAIDVVNQTLQTVPDPPIPPFVESRYYAMVNIAMHDALNSIVPKYDTYALKDVRKKNASADAAVAQAAYEVITAFYDKLNAPAFVTPPPVKDYISNLLNTSLASIPAGQARDEGIALGKEAAAAILVKRASDGVMNVMFPVTQGTQPGEYRFTFPFNGPPFNTPPFSGLYDAPGWGNVTPFGMQSGAQFRPGAPDPIGSAAYTADFNEVKRLGRFNSADRTAEQTEIAKFWAESSPQGWNRIAVAALRARNLKAWQAARLLALLQMAEADAYIGCLEAKYHYFYWRPVTAIRLADTDGNPNTGADPDWEVLGWNPAGPPDFRYWPTPPVAEYPSAHAQAGGAGAAVIARIFGSDQIVFQATSTSLPGVTRGFSKLSDAARENALSRIYIGFHFRKACLEGEKQGALTGLWIADRFLKEK
jgi:hypothetical protein